MYVTKNPEDFRYSVAILSGPVTQLFLKKVLLFNGGQKAVVLQRGHKFEVLELLLETRVFTRSYHHYKIFREVLLLNQ